MRFNMIWALVSSMIVGRALGDGTCATPPAKMVHNYSSVLSQSRRSQVAFEELPGFTRSVYYRDHAVITPESRVWAGQPGWKNALTTHLVARASGANFAMYMAELKAGGEAGKPAAHGAERFVLVLDGHVTLKTPDGKTIGLKHNDYAYFPPGDTSVITSSSGAGLLLYERIYSLKGSPVFLHGHVEDSALLPTAGEVFELRKLLPQTEDYDFNIHVMDFKPGEHLFVKEVHYNQHGLLMLEGQGIYRLANSWYPVQSGDAIWMAPFVPQWYAALGTKPTRYIIYKDTIVDPLL